MIILPKPQSIILVSADPSGFILFPLVVHSFDLVISSVGILSIRGTRDLSAKSPIEDPMAILQKGYSVTILLAVLTFGLVMLYLQLKPVLHKISVQLSLWYIPNYLYPLLGETLTP